MPKSLLTSACNKFLKNRGKFLLREKHLTYYLHKKFTKGGKGFELSSPGLKKCWTWAARNSCEQTWQINKQQIMFVHFYFGYNENKHFSSYTYSTARYKIMNYYELWIILELLTLCSVVDFVKILMRKFFWGDTSRRQLKMYFDVTRA